MHHVVWITGASSGIGAALVAEYARQGWLVIATARREALLNHVAQDSGFSERISLLPADLTDLEALPALVDQAWSLHGGIDCCILNAGMGQWGSVTGTALSVEERLFALNYWSPVATIKALLPKMERAGFGRIVGISSIASQFGQRKLAAYSASKAALHLYFESLREELYQSPVRVQIVSPGSARTNIMQASLTESGEPLMKSGKAQEQGMDPAKLAQAIWRFAQGRGFHAVLAGKDRLALPLHHYFPQLFYRILRRNYARK